MEPDPLPASPAPRAQLRAQPHTPTQCVLSSCLQPTSKANDPAGLSRTGPCRRLGAQLPAGGQPELGLSLGAVFLSLGICTLGTAASWGPEHPVMLCPQGGAPKKRRLPGRLGTRASRGPTVLFIETPGHLGSGRERTGVSLSEEGRAWAKLWPARVPPRPAGVRPPHFIYTDTADRGRPGHPARCGLKPIL